MQQPLHRAVHDEVSGSQARDDSRGGGDAACARSNTFADDDAGPRAGAGAGAGGEILAAHRGGSAELTDAEVAGGSAARDRLAVGNMDLWRPTKLSGGLTHIFSSIYGRLPWLEFWWPNTPFY